MPVQTQMSSLFKNLGGLAIAQAHAECAGKPPVEMGRRQLPPNIRGGIAKLSTLYTKEQDKDEGICPKGRIFFRGSASVIGVKQADGTVSPYFEGVKVAGAVTSVTIPLCDVQAKVGDGYTKEAVPLAENWNKFRSLLEFLGVDPFPEQIIDYKRDPQGSTAQGQRIWDYYMAGMMALVNPAKPLYLEFSTRGFKRKKKLNESQEAYDKIEPMVYEDWHGKVDYDGRVAPGTGVQDNSGAGGTQPHPMTPPPSGNGSPTTAAPGQARNPREDYEAQVEGLVEVAMRDPDGEGSTPEGADAKRQLFSMATAAGWSQEQVGNAADWAAVGNMALEPPTAAPAGAPEIPSYGSNPSVGSKWMYQKRTKDGTKLKDGKNNDLPAHEVEVVTLDAATKTCTVKTTKDGKDIVDLRTKKPVQVKWEWLDRGQPY